MQLFTYTLPAAWASALINNDNSGLTLDDPEEAERCAAWQARENGRALDVSEPYTDRMNGQICTVADYTFTTH